MGQRTILLAFEFKDLLVRVSCLLTWDVHNRLLVPQMDISRPLLRAVTALGFEAPSLVQQRAIPIALAGRDLCVCAQTGSGKTAAFMLPVLERLMFRPKKVAQTRVMVLSPTRELAVQVRFSFTHLIVLPHAPLMLRQLFPRSCHIHLCHSRSCPTDSCACMSTCCAILQVYDMSKKLAQFTDISFGLAVGGMGLRPQEAELRARPDVIVATPGRLVDHITNTFSFSLDGVEIVVMDEADR